MRSSFHLLISIHLWIGSTAVSLNSPVQVYLGGSKGCPPTGREEDEQFANVPSVEGILLPLNSSDPTSKQFCNRFRVRDQFYKAGGPVFLYRAGENKGEESLGYIASKNGTADENLTFFEMMLKNFNGMGVLTEHRYYGKSIPEGANILKRSDVDFR